jgi:predicted DNA helicase
MKELVIKGLNNEGPGDIVGAITAEAGVDSEDIGKIDIRSEFATVEISSDVFDKVKAEMDGNQIGGTEVEVKSLRYDMNQDENYFDKYKDLVELEREEEMRQHKQEMKSLSGQQREDKGRAILHLSGSDQGEGLGGHLVKFTRNHDGEEIPDNEISVGDLVMLSKQDPLRDDNPTGTVAEMTNYSITVSFDQKPHDFVFSKDLRMDLYVNDITFQRMIDALDQLDEADDKLAKLKEVIMGKTEPEKFSAGEPDYWHNRDLNESQKEAVKNSLGAKDFHLVHGPPGTGKTTTAIEIIKQHIDQGDQVLAVADSNIAVDNMLEFLLEEDVQAVRVGHPARITPKLREHTIDNIVEKNDNYQKSQELREQAFELKDKQDELTYPSGKYRRGMSDEQIKDLAGKGQGSRGVSSEKIQDMAEAIELEDKIDDLFDKSRQFEDKAVKQVLSAMNVVCTTNSTAGSGIMADHEFDVVVIDEATQATEPSCLIPITKAKKVIMAGDHKQLPPTIKNQEAAKRGLEETLFERLAYEYGDEIKDMLTKQYRMHEDIMNFSSEHFYDGVLEADDSVIDHTLEDLDFDTSQVDESMQDVTDPVTPVSFINLTGSNVQEESKKDSNSKLNREEAKYIIQLSKNFLAGGINPENLAVISPYQDQVDLIQSKLDYENLEVDTVDGFQGREKEVILISLVRSNRNNKIGFLRDVRRLNVALTRAKRKLVVVGDEVTVGSDETYQDFIEYVSKNGLHYTKVA